MNTFLRVALVQRLHESDLAVSIEEAANEGAELVVFPEMYSNGYASFTSGDAEGERAWRAGAVDVGGAFVERFRRAAQLNQIHVIGTFLESGDPDPFDSAVLIDPLGNAILHHRKVHTCFFDVPEKACGRGDSFLTVPMTTKVGQVRVGILICMDREYAAAAMALSRAGAEITLVPNCSMLAVDPICGDVRIAQTRGRAFETVMGIAVANYPSPRSDGHSFAVDPYGKVVAMANHLPAVVLVDFDVREIRRIRQEDWFRWRG